MKHRLQQNNCFSFPSLAKVRGSKSQNEQEQRYHIPVKMSAVRRNALNTNFAMTILAVSGNRGVKTSIFDKNDFQHFCGPKFSTMFSKKKRQIVLSLDFSVSIICNNIENS